MTNYYEPPRSGGLDRTYSDKGEGKATASLVLGCVSIIAWCLPIVGIPTSITGLVLGIKGLGPQRRGKAIAGIILSSVFLFFSLANAAAGLYLAMTGQHPLFNAK